MEKLGATIGAMFQSALSFINAVVTNFDYKALAKGIGDGINSAFSAINWAMLGSTISTAIKNAFEFIKTLADTIDFKQIGDDVATALNNIDWPGIFGNLAGMLSSLLKGALDLLIGFAEKLDWNKLGTDIYNSLIEIVTNIDWNGVISKAIRLCGDMIGASAALFNSIFVAIENSLHTAWLAVKDYFREKIAEAGGNVWQGVLDGICEGLLTIGTWIKKNIVDPFIDGFKKAFGIHSPSTLMAEMGGYLIEGLKNGISDSWSNIITFFTDAWRDIKSVCIDSWEQTKENCKRAWDKVSSTIIDVCKKVAIVVSEKFGVSKKAVSENVRDIQKSVVTTFSNAWITISKKVGSMHTKISTGFRDMHKTVQGKVEAIGTIITTTFSTLATNAWTWGSDICINIANGISSMAGTVWDSVESLARSIADYLGFSEPEKGPLSNFHTYMPDMLKLMADGIKKNKGIAINAVSDLAGAISDEAQNAKVLMPINAENQYARILDTFSDTITESFIELISRLEAIAGNVTFATPAVAEGTVIPYKIRDSINGDINKGSDPLLLSNLAKQVSEISSKLDKLDKLDDVVDAIDSKETGITDEVVFNSVKKSARKETKATGRNPFGG